MDGLNYFEKVTIPAYFLPRTTRSGVELALGVGTCARVGVCVCGRAGVCAVDVEDVDAEDVVGNCSSSLVPM